jgi:hypothetical protein
MSNLEILSFVFESGRITSDSSDWDNYVAEVEAEVRFEAAERAESGEFTGDIEECVAFALSHIG